MHIPFNKIYLSGQEAPFLQEVLLSGKLSADGPFSPRCRDYFEEQYHFENTFLTASCTAALEMMALLLDIQPGDEIIAPAYTFVSTINPFILRGAVIRFVDSRIDSPNMDVNLIRPLINAKTKAIIAMHYAGQACDMHALEALSKEFQIPLLEDAAHAIDAYYDNRPLGSFAAMSAFSFHASKNIVAGEGGLLVINDAQYLKRAQLIFEKGTNRTAFSKGEVPAYEWMDIGSSFAASELSAACLYAQLNSLTVIQSKRKALWQAYYSALSSLAEQQYFELPTLLNMAEHNAHLFFIVCKNKEARVQLSAYLKEKGIETAFHYQALNQSPFYKKHYPALHLPQAERYADCLLRLPLYPDLSMEELQYIVQEIQAFFKN
jgi:dTDP-4-amino-4,6-dideoxygalactose transaminase